MSDTKAKQPIIPQKRKDAGRFLMGCRAVDVFDKLFLLCAISQLFQHCFLRFGVVVVIDKFFVCRVIRRVNVYHFNALKVVQAQQFKGVQIIALDENVAGVGKIDAVGAQGFENLVVWRIGAVICRFFANPAQFKTFVNHFAVFGREKSLQH